MRAWLAWVLLVLAACSGNEHPGFGQAPAASPTGDGGSPGRGSATEPPPVAGMVAVATSGASFDPDGLVLRRNSRVEVAFTNRGDETHTLVVNELNFHMTADPGETVRLTVSVPSSPGSFRMFCSIVGHGERGRVVVR